jgi:effector-binding domain-containing protein
VKTTEPMVVAYVQSTAMLDELETQAMEALRKLAQDVAQAGFTLIPQFVLRMDMPQTMEGNTQVAWEAQIPVANECPKEGARDYGSFKMKPVPARRVAYTFHQGNPQGLEYTIQMLGGWMMQQGLAPGNKLTFVSRSDPTNTPETSMIMEVRIDTNAP